MRNIKCCLAGGCDDGWTSQVTLVAEMTRPIGQKIALAFAVLCYVAAVGCVLAAIIYTSKGPHDAVRAAFMASVVFFAGCGVVLHVIGTARLQGVLSGSGEHDRQ